MAENMDFDPMSIFGTMFLDAIVNLNEEEMDKMSEVFSSAASRLEKEQKEAEEKDAKKEEELPWNKKKSTDEKEEELPFCDGDCASCEDLPSCDGDDESCDEDDEEEAEYPMKDFDVDKIYMSKNKMTVVWMDGTKTHVINTFDEKMTPWTGFCAAVAERLYESKETALMQLEYGLDRGAV